MLERVLRKDKYNTIWVDTLLWGIRLKSRVATKHDFYTLVKWRNP